MTYGWVSWHLAKYCDMLRHDTSYYDMVWSESDVTQHDKRTYYTPRYGMTWYGIIYKYDIILYDVKVFDSKYGVLNSDPRWAFWQELFGSRSYLTNEC